MMMIPCNVSGPVVQYKIRSTHTHGTSCLSQEHTWLARELEHTWLARELEHTWLARELGDLTYTLHSRFLLQS